jgi:AAA family ATP:ADP antiporter
LHKGLSLLGSSRAVFVAGLVLALGMTAGAWRLLRAAQRLPSEQERDEMTGEAPAARATG